MRMFTNKVDGEDTRKEVESVTEQTKQISEEIQSYRFLTNLIFDAIR